ncbi:MAG: hypothetical protein EOP86_07100 [Verrucomicrobiaceae bacterium]|nr:MAG: hypothetical protein EOP86_07100 [Verrucomicrobiaceae bacterium]
MQPSSFHQALRELPILCQGRTERLGEWLANPTGARLAACAVAIAAGGAAYGFTLGLWRAPLMGGYVALKLPLLLSLTLLTNGLMNGMLAQVLGSGLSFRQTVMAMLMSFTTFALITGALSPVALALVWNAAGPGEPGGSVAYRVILLTQTAVIAFAGITAHRRFWPVLRAASASPQAGALVFMAWLAGNLFVGAQLSWNLRPFFGQPARPVELFRADWNRSSFYESIYKNLTSFLP